MARNVRLTRPPNIGDVREVSHCQNIETLDLRNQLQVKYLCMYRISIRHTCTCNCSDSTKHIHV